jgi:hypothetical protein
MSYDVAWNRSWLVWSKRSERAAPWVVECILFERTLIEGKPALRFIARLAKILEDELDNRRAAISSGATQSASWVN